MKPSLCSRTLAAILTVSLFAAPSPAQPRSGNKLSGRVMDANTGLPVENANIFLGQTVLGTSSDEQGNYTLARIPRGTYRLVVSRVGYQMQTESLTLGENESYWREFNMVPLVLQADEVQVSGEAQSVWKKHFRDFSEKFLGTCDNASYCTIKNPEVISFGIDSISHDLVATSQDLIEVENRALGYRVSIALGLFSWDLRRDQGQYLIFPRFEPLQTVYPDSFAFWEMNREKSYNTSLQHFLASLVAGTLEKDRYEVNIGTLSFLRSGSRRGIEQRDITVQPTGLWGMKRVMFNDWLQVEHYGEGQKQTNYVALDQGVTMVDSTGNLNDPMTVHVIGPWQDRRVADMLPLFWTKKRPEAN